MARSRTAQADEARSAPLVLHVAHDPNSLAPYFVEEIRRYLEGKYGTDQVHEGGLKVYTSLDVDMQKAANQAVLDGLAAYERRHGWKNHLENIIAEGLDPAKYFNSDWDDELQVNAYVHALVTSAGTGIATSEFGRIHGSAGASRCGVDRTEARQSPQAGRPLLREDSFAGSETGRRT